MNFDIIRKYVADLGIPQKYDTRCDLYFDIQLIRRGKDHPDLPAANYTFKTYYIDCLDNFDKYKDEIKNQSKNTKAKTPKVKNKTPKAKERS